MSKIPSKHCPICNNIMLLVEGYPNVICDKHYGECYDKDGNSVLYETGIGGGFASYHIIGNTIEKRDDGICFVRNHKCTAGEGHYGKIVIQLMK